MDNSRLDTTRVQAAVVQLWRVLGKLGLALSVERDCEHSVHSSNSVVLLVVIPLASAAGYCPPACHDFALSSTIPEHGHVASSIELEQNLSGENN